MGVEQAGAKSFSNTLERMLREQKFLASFSTVHSYVIAERNTIPFIPRTLSRTTCRQRSSVYLCSTALAMSHHIACIFY